MALPGVRTNHKPAPFQKPGITISETLHGSKKRWVRSHPERLEIGDIIRGHGLIVGGEIKDRYDPRTRSRLSYVTFELKNGTSLAVDALDTVIAFTEAEGEPVG